MACTSAHLYVNNFDFFSAAQPPNPKRHPPPPRLDPQNKNPEYGTGPVVNWLLGGGTDKI